MGQDNLAKTHRGRNWERSVGTVVFAEIDVISYTYMPTLGGHP